MMLQEKPLTTLYKKNFGGGQRSNTQNTENNPQTSTEIEIKQMEQHRQDAVVEP